MRRHVRDSLGLFTDEKEGQSWTAMCQCPFHSVWVAKEIETSEKLGSRHWA
jgi:hypothetical protein